MTLKCISTFNEGKSVVPERFIKTLKNKTYKHVTTVGENVYCNVLDNIVDKYNNSIHSSIKMEPKDVNEGNALHSDSSAEHNEESNKKRS